MEYQLLAGLKDDDRRAVLAAAVRRRFKRGEVVFHEGDLGDTFHHIARGKVAIRVSTPAGDVATVAVLVRGDGFGEHALLEPDSRRMASVIALEATETIVLSHSQFEELRSVHPTVNDLLIDHLVRQVRRLTEHYTDALFLPAEQRVLKRVLELDDLYGGGEIALTQDDLATIAGTTRPTANRALQRLIDAGQVAASRGRLRVLDRPALERRAR